MAFPSFVLNFATAGIAGSGKKAATMAAFFVFPPPPPPRYLPAAFRKSARDTVGGGVGLWIDTKDS